MATDSVFVAHRSEVLADVFLTRRPDVQSQPFEYGELDRLVQVSVGKSAFQVFGTIVWGTANALPTEEAASSHANARWRNRKRLKREYHYYFPVLLLVFSMEGDRGYWSWVTEPLQQEDRPRLKYATTVEVEAIGQDTLDRIVTDVSNWYGQLDRLLYAQD